MKKCRVKIWGNPLRCPVCQQDIFHFRKVCIIDQGMPDKRELSYLFECTLCGYGALFSGDNVAKNEAAAALAQPPAISASGRSAKGDHQ